jgi:hypothetical protein
MRKANLTVTPAAGDPVSGAYAAGEEFEAAGVTIHINRVRAAAATMSTSAPQDIALGVGESAALDGGGTITLTSIVADGLLSNEDA